VHIAQNPITRELRISGFCACTYGRLTPCARSGRLPRRASSRGSTAGKCVGVSMRGAGGFAWRGRSGA